MYQGVLPTHTACSVWRWHAKPYLIYRRTAPRAAVRWAHKIAPMSRIIARPYTCMLTDIWNLPQPFTTEPRRMGMLGRSAQHMQTSAKPCDPRNRNRMGGGCTRSSPNIIIKPAIARHLGTELELLIEHWNKYTTRSCPHRPPAAVRAATIQATSDTD